MENKTFDGSTNSDWYTATNWDADTLPPAGANLTIDAAAVMDANDANVYGTVVINATKSINMATFNLNCGYMTVNGTHTMGVSAGTGLTCAGLAFNSGSTRAWETASKVNNSSDYIFLTGATAAAMRGTYVQTAPGVFRNAVTNSPFYSIIQNAGAHIKNFDSVESILSGSSTVYAEFNANLDCSTTTGTSGFLIRATATGTIILGATCNILGVATKNIATYIETGMTLTNNMTVAPSYPGRFVVTHGSGSNIGTFFAGDFRNSIFVIGSPSSGARDRYFPAGTLKVHSVIMIGFALSFDITLKLAATNTTIEIYGGDFSLLKASGAGNVIWQKGTGKIKFIDGVAGTINTVGNEVEEMTFERCPAKSIAGDFTTSKISGSGTLKSDVSGTLRTITVTDFSPPYGLYVCCVKIADAKGRTYEMMKNVYDQTGEIVRKKI